MPDDAGMASLFERALRGAAALGITAVQDAWGRPEELRLLRGLAAGGSLPIRVRLALEMPPWDGGTDFPHRLDELEALRAEEPNGAHLRTGILKSFLDGVVEAR